MKNEFAKSFHLDLSKNIRICYEVGRADVVMCSYVCFLFNINELNSGKTFYYFAQSGETLKVKVNENKHTHTHTRARPHTHTHTHTYTYTHTRTHELSNCYEMKIHS